MLQINDDWIQVALRVSDEDGPGQGDRTLLKNLLRHQVVIKPKAFNPNCLSDSGSSEINRRLSSTTNAIGKQPALIQILERAGTLKFHQKNNSLKKKKTKKVKR